MTALAYFLVSSGLCVVASACVSTGLAFHATFAVSLVFLVRVLSPEDVDGVFAHVYACVRRQARHARAAIGAKARSLRDEARVDPVIAPIYARAEECAPRAHAFVTDLVDGLKRRAGAKWSGFQDAAVAAFFWLCLTAGVINLAATALFTIACEEAKSRAPSVLRWRGVKGIRSPPNKEGQDPAVSPVSKPDSTLLVVWISAILMYCTQVLVLDAICSGITTFAACFACFTALCGFALMEAERVYLWGSYDIATGDSSDTANRGRRVGNAAEGITAIDLRDAWEYLWSHIIMTFVSDACFLLIVLGNRPLAIASLAICNLAALKVAKQSYQTPDDGEEADGSADGAHGDVNKWHGAAMMVLAIDVAKVATYLLLDFCLGVLCFASLCMTTACLFDKADCLSDVRASGDDDNQDCAGLGRDVTGDAEVSDEVRAEDSSTIAVGDHEEEGSATEEHSDVSESEKHFEEQRHEESDYSSSSSIDDWSFVDVDLTMPVNVNGGASRKSRFLQQEYVARV